MKRTLHRLFITITASGGLLAAAAAVANAGPPRNHCEPVTRDNR